MIFTKAEKNKEATMKKTLAALLSLLTLLSCGIFRLLCRKTSRPT